MGIEKLSATYGSRLIMNEKTKSKIDTFIDYLKDNSEIEIINVPAQLANAYKGDLYGLLGYLQIEYDLWYITVLLNDFDSSNSYDGELELSVISASDVIKNMVINKIK